MPSIPVIKRYISRGFEKLGIRYGGGLKRKLLQEGRTRWLDIGSSKMDKGFICLNIESPPDVKSNHDDVYYQASILELKEIDFQALGTFDLVRMQHVFEHFSYEEGKRVLNSCSRLLKSNGYLLITVPDLHIHLIGYRTGYRRMGFAVDFAHKRVPKDAPASFIFSNYVHQEGYAPDEAPGQAHKWCYDYEGIRYQLKKNGNFENIRKLDLLSRLAETPFTHNRPPEDLCVLAQKS